MGLASSASAQTVWRLDVNGNWGDSTKWNPQAVPNRSGAAAALGAVITAPRTITMNLPVTLGSLVIDNANSYTIVASGTPTLNRLALDTDGPGSALLSASGINGAGSHEMQAYIELLDPLEISVSTNVQFSIGPIMGGTGYGVDKVGAGVLVLKGPTSYTGLTKVSGGTLKLQVPGDLPRPAALQVAQTATFDLNGADPKLSSLSGVGSITNSSNSRGYLLLDLSSSQFDGVIGGNNRPIDVELQKGLLRLSKPQTYSGKTSILNPFSVITLGPQAGLPSTTELTGVGALDLGGSATQAGVNQTVAKLTGTLDIWNDLGIQQPVGAIFTISDPANSTFDGTLRGNLALEKGGQGSLTLTGQNTYVGRTVVTDGLLKLGRADIVQSGVVLLNDGRLDLAGFEQSVTWLAGSPDALVGDSQTNTINYLTADIGGADLSVFNGVIADKIQLHKEDIGTLELGGANTYSEGTIIRGGTILVSNAQGSATGAGDVAVEDGGILKGTGSCAGEVTIKANGTIVPGRTIGALTVGTLVLDHDDSRFVVDLDRPNRFGPPDNDLLVVSGDLVLNGSLIVNAGSNFGPGRYRLISYGGQLIANNTLTVAVGVNGTIDLSVPGFVDLVVTPAVPAASGTGLFIMTLLLVLAGAHGATLSSKSRG